MSRSYRKTPERAWKNGHKNKSFRMSGKAIRHLSVYEDVSDGGMYKKFSTFLDRYRERPYHPYEGFIPQRRNWWTFDRWYQAMFNRHIRHIHVYGKNRADKYSPIIDEFKSFILWKKYHYWK